MLQELQFLFPTRRLMLLYICTRFHENIINGINVTCKEQTRFSLKNLKGHNFTKIVGGVTVLVLCTLSETSFSPAGLMKISLTVFKL